VRIHYCQHVPFEPPAAIAEWAADRDHDLTGSHLHAGHDLPDPDVVDVLAVMGGPMGVDDDHAWLATERDLIRGVLDTGGSVFGVCLGAQQLAAALGADVYPNDVTEIGWYSVTATDAASETLFDSLPAEYTPLSWHGDTFDLPDGATLTATSEACRNQAFVARKGRAVGVQFHLEATPGSVADLVAASDQSTGEWIQSAERLRSSGNYHALHDHLGAVLDSVASNVVGPES